MLRAMLLLIVLAAPAAAQPERYELGQRLKAFEKAWEKHREDPAARKRALAILPNVTQQFFSLQLGEAGRTLDQARWALESDKEPSDATKWLTSLYAVPEKRLYDDKATEINVEIKPFYKMKTPAPAGARFRLSFFGDDGVQAELKGGRQKFTVPIPKRRDGRPGDHLNLWLSFDRVADATGMLNSAIMIARVENLAEDLEQCKKRLAAAKDQSSIEYQTIRTHVEMFESALQGDVGETDIPYGSLTLRAKFHLDATATPPSADWTYNPPLQNAGEWDQLMTLPLAKGKPATVRIFTPGYFPFTKPKAKPIVFALHGAGATENMFFESYGDGWIVEACKSRGWYLVAPRSGIGFGSAPRIKEMLECLSKRMPVDTGKVFILGHSMGAMQTIAACQENTGLFRAAAALGGGGRVTKPEAFKDLPVFIGVGDKDFALSGAKALNKSLKDGGAKNVTYKEYPDLEHLVIVRESLPDVFKMFDEVLKKDK